MKLYPPYDQLPGQTPASVVSSLALRHGRESASLFAWDMGFSFRSVINGEDFALDALASLIGGSTEALRAAAIIRDREGFHHRGQRLVKGTLRRSRIFGCPCCLSEDLANAGGQPWAVRGRVHWQLEPLLSCRRHEVMLVQLVDPASMPYDFARLVEPVARNLPRLADAAKNVEPSAFEEYLERRLEGADGPTWLDGLEWHAAAKVCEMLGVVACFGRRTPMRTLTKPQLREARSAGFEIASGGEPAIRDFLVRLRTTFPESKIDPSGPQAWFGRIHTWLTDTVREGAYDPLRRIILDLVRDSVPVGPDVQFFGQQVVEHRRLHSIRTAALETGLHPKRLRRILTVMNVIGKDHRALSDDRVIFSTEDAAPVLAKAQRAISHQEAEDYLGAGRVHTALLAKSGFIRPFAFSGEERMGEHAYDRKDLDAFLASLTEGAVQVLDAAPPVYRIPEAAKRTNCGSMEIVKLILDRELRYVGQVAGESGYSSVVVDLEEVRAKIRKPHTVQLTLVIVQQELKTTFRVVDALVKTGILPSERAISPINRCPFTAVRRTDLDAFKAAYAALQTVAAERGMHHLAAKKKLNALGVSPAFDREAVNATFYRRSDLPPVL